MERESFEDHEIAGVLNAHFISIKIDREERPDVDKVYMTFVQATTGQGGWPLNVFLTPELKPFFGGTYFPPAERHGRPGFADLLRQLDQVWTKRRTEINSSATNIAEQIRQSIHREPDRGYRLDSDTLKTAAAVLMRHYDWQHGGFGNAPKFPQPGLPQFILRYGKRFKDDEAVRMVLHTCERMAAGGIHDQLGGGFARYSVDAQWLVPHFEKMLYDNAQLAHLYLEAFLVSGDPQFSAVVRDILDYVLRDMTHPEGGFYSAEDADSEGQEGKFYCWTVTELQEVLDPAGYEAVKAYYGVTEHGNFVDHSHPAPLPNLNVLSVVRAELAGQQAAALAAARETLLHVRASRVRPHRDDKVLASWNGLMLGAMARAAITLKEPAYLAAAEKNADFLQRVLWEEGPSGTGALFHRWREGERDHVELLEGYAFVLLGFIDLYEATLNPDRLSFAIHLADSMLEKFYDRDQGGFWQSTASDLILRFKDDHDGAEPSGNSIATLALLKLGEITGRQSYTQAASRTLEFFAERLSQTPQAMPCLLQAVDFALEKPFRVVITGKDRSDLLATAHSVYQPNKVVLGTEGPVEEFAQTLLHSQTAEAFLCTGTACRQPTSDAANLRASLAIS
jgi:hypothetical protein